MMDQIDSCQRSRQLAALHPGQKWRWSREADGSCECRGSKIRVWESYPCSSPGKEAIPNGYLYPGRSTNILNSAKRGETPLKLKKTHYRRCTLQLFRWEALRADLLFPTHFYFWWHKQRLKLSGRCQEGAMGWLLESQSCFKKSSRISSYLGGWIYSPSSPGSLCNSCFQAYSCQSHQPCFLIKAGPPVRLWDQGV